MGEMAQDVIEGFCCSVCCTYFEEEHGYPVVCKVCARGMSKKNRKRMGVQVAEATETGGD